MPRSHGDTLDHRVPRVHFVAMATFTGTIGHNDLEGGFFELCTDSGKTYRLDGGTGLRKGDRVRIEGEIDTGGFGLQMSGPALKVERVEKI